MTVTTRLYAGQTAAERDDQRRARVRTACRQLIGSQGYAATTVGNICSTAGVSTRHFYQHFDNKEAAFIDLYESINAVSFQAAVDSLTETAGRPIAERVPKAFLAYLSPMVRDVRTARIAFVEIMGVSPQMEERRLELRESLVALVEAEGRAAVASGEIRPRDFRFATLALAGAATAIVYDWTVREDRSGVDQLEDSLTELAVVLLNG